MSCRLNLALLLSSLILFGACGGDGPAGPAGKAGQAGNPGLPGGEGEPGEPGPEGEQGDPAEPTAPTIAGVLPARVFREREVELVIAGDNTTWSSGVEVDLGDDVEVTSVTVASPTSLRVTVRADAAAEVGARDVVVDDGDLALVYEAAFRIDAPFELTVGGTAAQGAIVPLRGRMLDPSTPFDTTDDGGGFPYVGLSASDLSFVVEEVRPFEVRALGLVDVFADVGPRDVSVSSGADDSAMSSTADAGLEVVPRQPVELVDGLEGSVDAPFATALYVYVPPEEVTLVTIAVTADGPATAPSFALLPASGSYDDLIDFDDTTTFATDGSGDPYYVVFFDNIGSFDYPFELSLEEEAAPGNIEDESNDICVDANPIETVDPVLASLSDVGDVDFFEVQAEAGDVGRVVRVVTSPGDPATDTVVEVFAANCTTSMGGQSLDVGFHEDHRSSPVVAAGSIFVRVTNSTFGFSQSDYLLTVTFEDP